MPAVGAREIAAAVRVLARGDLSRHAGKAPSVTDRFEQELARFAGVAHALAVNSGTSALMSAFAALRIGPGDEVLVPAYTWISSAAAAVAVGAVPVLVDVDETLTMDPDDLERKITPRSRAVVPVHMLNLVCDLGRLLPMARAKGLLVVEDACQALGVRYHGRLVGQFGDAAALSFNQHKNIRSGEGGAVLTSSDETYVRALMFHDVGTFIRNRVLPHDEEPFVGMNLRMPELSSAVLRPQLARLEQQMTRRRRRRAVVVERLQGRQGLRISPHHSPEDAVGLTVLFDEPRDAQRFAEQPGVVRLADTGRHVYTNWQAVVGRRTFDSRMNPWSGDAVADYSAQACARTLDVLERTCTIALEPHVPLPVLRSRAARYARSV